LDVILFRWRNLVCLSLTAILPVSLFGDETAAAMLRSDGVHVFLNNHAAPPSVALYPNDLIETQRDAIARIEAAGSTADISPETLVQFQSDELVLDHGHLSVNTNRGLRVRVGCVTITPRDAANWTHYDVIDVNGKVTISALKLDVYVDAKSQNPRSIKHPGGSERSIVRESEKKERSEKCGAGYLNSSATVPGVNAILNSPWAVGAGTAIVGGITCWALCRSGQPISPTGP
jgi:hypothetical protein